MNFGNYIVLLLVVLSCILTFTHAEPNVPAPYLVAIYENLVNHICDGALLSMDVVITGLDCVRGKLADVLSVKAGIEHIEDAGQVNPAYIVHNKEYIGRHESNMDLDIGLIRVAPFGQCDKIKPITLCSPTTTLTPDKKKDEVIEMHVIGWSGFQPGMSCSVDRIIPFNNCDGFFSGQWKSFKKTTICTENSLKRTNGRLAGPGAPGVVDGNLCAVTGSIYNSNFYTDLSVGSEARRYIKELTGLN